VGLLSLEVRGVEGGRVGLPRFIAVQNKLKWYFKEVIRPQKHKRSDRIYF